MATYKTPGVYVEEIPTLPSSVAEVETAIPAFFGFTEKGGINTPQKIGSLLEFEQFFGKGEPETEISVTLVKGSDPTDFSIAEVFIDSTKKSKNVLYYAMQLFYANGGGPCFVTSAGLFADSAGASVAMYQAALGEIAKEDEPTLLVFPDAPFLLSTANYYSLMGNALQQCNTLGDRFAIIDVVDTGGQEASKTDFRNASFIADDDHAKYGAAYYPYLNTTIGYQLDDTNNYQDVLVSVADNSKIAQALDDAKQTANQAHVDAKNAQDKLDIANNALANVDNADAAALKAAKDAVNKATQTLNDKNNAAKAADDAVKAAAGAGGVTVKNFKDLLNITQKQIIKKISEVGVQLTPCAAIAGVYANVDNDRGVWKAPANVGLISVTAAAVKITDLDQQDLNVDVDAGKSINAIRFFTGQGIKVWGARTLDGNDNEWRYINVRRFFNMVEESVKKSIFWAVFEPNESNTWVKVRAMIENYLLLKWKDGALAGAKPDDAFYVRVGLGQTMTAQDILEGRMIIEIGMAVARPAEFIILRFLQKLQVS